MGHTAVSAIKDSPETLMEMCKGRSFKELSNASILSTHLILVTWIFFIHALCIIH